MHTTAVKKKSSALLALADGTVFFGDAIGAVGHSTGEIVFNTALTGYQEILTDPSYSGQIITFTASHIGNVGVNQNDSEAKKIFAKGIVVKSLSITASNWRSERSLNSFLQEHNIVGIEGIDTRKLVKILRTYGAQGACIATDNMDKDLAVKKARDFAGLDNIDLASAASVENNSIFTEKSYKISGKNSLFCNHKYHVVAYDFGVKAQILRLLADRGCKITLVPAKISAHDIIALNPDGILLTNGPGDPAACDYAIKNIKFLLEKNIPIFGICFGCQLLALACGAKTYKMKFGHHGANHPVKDLLLGNVNIPSQNHGFAVDEASLPDYLQVTHRSLFDGTVQGIKHTQKRAFAFQGHPEASPGPHDIEYLFDQFIENMNAKKN